MLNGKLEVMSVLSLQSMCVMNVIFVPRNMLGTTESVFAPDPDEQKKTKQQQPVPMSILKQLAQENAIRMPGKDVARNAGKTSRHKMNSVHRLVDSEKII